MGENKLIMARNGKYAMYNGVALEVADSLCAQGCVGKSVVVYTSLLNEKIGIEVCVDTKQVTISRYRQFKDIIPYFLLFFNSFSKLKPTLNHKKTEVRCLRLRLGNYL